MARQPRAPDRTALERVFELKYGPAGEAGKSPRLRLRHGYFNPDDWYEALVDTLVRPDTKWLDVGCGRDLFPNNVPLAHELSARTGDLVGLDPDPNLLDNPFVHQRIQAPADAFSTELRFNLITMRMVAEHLERPEAVAHNLARVLLPGGLVVVYTVFRFSPVPMLTAVTPMALRHPIKRVLWGTEKRDTFPTRFRMNTRRRLRALFASEGLEEVLFLRLDDCRTFGRFHLLLSVELWARKIFRAIGIPYPEHCLLGVYRSASGGSG